MRAKKKHASDAQVSLDSVGASRKIRKSQRAEKTVPQGDAAESALLASSNQLHLPVLMEYEELQELQINAATDPLTGLYNRRLFEEHFERELNRALRYNQHLALVTLDLHQFKEVNDRYGHPRGDLLLRTVAATLRKSLRNSDYAFRIGGDEFALLLIQADTEQTTKLARRVCAHFIVAIQSMQMSMALGLDYGLAVYPEDGDQQGSPDTCRRRASL
jgi:diguanylate cyclase (GGDEF)-like protein